MHSYRDSRDVAYAPDLLYKSFLDEKEHHLIESVLIWVPKIQLTIAHQLIDSESSMLKDSYDAYRIQCRTVDLVLAGAMKMRVERTQQLIDRYVRYKMDVYHRQRDDTY